MRTPSSLRRLPPQLSSPAARPQKRAALLKHPLTTLRSMSRRTPAASSRWLAITTSWPRALPRSTSRRSPSAPAPANMRRLRWKRSARKSYEMPPRLCLAGGLLSSRLRHHAPARSGEPTSFGSFQLQPRRLRHSEGSRVRCAPDRDAWHGCATDQRHRHEERRG